VGQTPDGDRAAAAGKLLQEAHRVTYFDFRGPAVRSRLTGTMRMSRDDVPEQHVLVDTELVERASDDRRRRLGGPAAGALALGRERHAADARAAVAGGFADQEEASV
jgi:hypothetical protein